MHEDRMAIEVNTIHQHLFSVLREKNVAGLRGILERHVDVNFVDSDGNVPMAVAIEFANLECVKLLSAAGCDLDFGGKESPLHTAIRLRKTDIVDYLLHCKVDVQRLNSENESPLYSAVRVRDLNLVRVLTDRGIDVNSLNNNNMSPLYIAVGLRCIPVVKYLLNNGANPNTNGLPCLKLAQDMRDTQMINLLIGAGARAQIRPAHRSRQQQTALSRLAPLPPLSRIDDGVCFMCKERFNLLRFVPCAHAVVCKKCIDNFAGTNNHCPLCQMAYYATKPKF
jgi:ankyrin repeat protein